MMVFHFTSILWLHWDFGSFWLVAGAFSVQHGSLLIIELSKKISRKINNVSIYNHSSSLSLPMLKESKSRSSKSWSTPSFSLRSFNLDKASFFTSSMLIISGSSVLSSVSPDSSGVDCDSVMIDKSVFQWIILWNNLTDLNFPPHFDGSNFQQKKRTF